MTDLERLKMEIRVVDYPESDLVVYLAESGIVDIYEYNPISTLAKKDSSISVGGSSKALAVD